MRWGSSVMPIWWRRKATIGAKSFSDHGSGSGGEGGSMPDVATLDSLTVQRPQGREHTIQVQYEQERLLVTDQAADEGGRLPKSKLGRGLHLLGGKLQHVGNPVHHQSGDLESLPGSISTISTLGARSSSASACRPKGIRKS